MNCYITLSSPNTSLLLFIKQWKRKKPSKLIILCVNNQWLYKNRANRITSHHLYCYQLKSHDLIRGLLPSERSPLIALESSPLLPCIVSSHNSCTPRISESDLFGSEVFADVLEVRIGMGFYWMRVGPKSHEHVLVRDRKGEDTETQRRYENRGKYWGDACTNHRASRMSSKHHRLGGTYGRMSLRVSKRNQPVHTLIWNFC